MPLPGALRALCMVTFNQSHHPCTTCPTFSFIHPPNIVLSIHPSPTVFCLAVGK